MDDMERLRRAIDTIDGKLIDLLASRFQVSRQIGALKRSLDLPPRDSGREARQMHRARMLALEQGVSPGLAEGVLRLIIDEVVNEHRLT